jgi:hypothetical protein
MLENLDLWNVNPIAIIRYNISFLRGAAWMETIDEI